MKDLGAIPARRVALGGDMDCEWVVSQYPITDDQIRALQTEARDAMDAGMIAVCDRALAGNSRALVRVIEVIQYAEAQRMDDSAVRP